MNALGVTAEERSPFCRSFSSPTESRDEFIAYLPNTFSFDDIGGNASADVGSGEADDGPVASPATIVLERVKNFASDMMSDRAKGEEDSNNNDVEVVDMDAGFGQ